MWMHPWEAECNPFFGNGLRLFEQAEHVADAVVGGVVAGFVGRLQRRRERREAPQVVTWV
jgi:hypothetical protein